MILQFKLQQSRARSLSIICCRGFTRVKRPWPVKVWSRECFFASSTSGMEALTLGFDKVDTVHPFGLEKDIYDITWIGLWANLGLFSIKSYIGVYTGAVCLLADAAHSAGDLLSDIVSLCALQVARWTPNEDYPYGYGHYETLGTLSVSLLLVTSGLGGANLAIQNAIEILKSYTDTPTMELSLVPEAMLVSCLSIAIKESLYRVTERIGREYNSSMLKANAWHHRSDALSSLVALVGVSGYGIGIPFLDHFAAIVVSGMLLKAGINVGWKSIKDLTDCQTESKKVIASILRIGKEVTIETGGQVIQVCNVNCRRMGPYDLVYLQLHVKGTVDVSTAYELSKLIEKRIVNEIPRAKDVFISLHSENKVA